MYDMGLYVKYCIKCGRFFPILNAVYALLYEHTHELKTTAVCHEIFRIGIVWIHLFYLVVRSKYNVKMDMLLLRTAGGQPPPEPSALLEKVNSNKSSDELKRVDPVVCVIWDSLLNALLYAVICSIK